jgi:NAD(P)H-dependent FMN reductase
MSKDSGTDPVRIALIVGSTRPNRFADVPVKWMLDAAAERSDLELEVLDLRDWALPFLGEPSPLHTGAADADPVILKWRERISDFDGFIATAAEYNHGPTAVLKNALDWARVPWHDKPIGFVGYGGVGGARAVEQLRLIAVELQMAPVQQAVHIGLEPFLAVLREGKSLNDYPFLIQTRGALLDQMVWWARALKVARQEREMVTSIAA